MSHKLDTPAPRHLIRPVKLIALLKALPPNTTWVEVNSARNLLATDRKGNGLAYIDIKNKSVETL